MRRFAPSGSMPRTLLHFFSASHCPCPRRRRGPCRRRAWLLPPPQIRKRRIQGPIRIRVRNRSRLHPHMELTPLHPQHWHCTPWRLVLRALRGMVDRAGCSRSCPALAVRVRCLLQRLRLHRRWTATWRWRSSCSLSRTLEMTRHHRTFETIAAVRNARRGIGFSRIGRKNL